MRGDVFNRGEIMEGQNEGLRFSSLGFALAAAIMLAACGGDSSSGAVNGGGSSDASYGKMTDRRDGQVYKTVKIGTQTWMAENLNYAVDSSWCYENSADSCAKYGRLYQWAAAMDIDASYNDEEWDGSDANHRGACPAGWHVPTDAEWTTLETAVGGSSVAGTKLKSRSGWNDDGDECGNGTDAYGFSALPAGSRDVNGIFDDVGHDAFFWSATEYATVHAYYRDLRNYYAYMYTGNDDGDKIFAFSVRCVQD
jgi:uncharacterized protein (TIGR02145 family)